jgi:16S rRNA (cytosine1402-N4)-methyltransferase
MDDRQQRTAADLVNTAPVEELARIFWEYGGERESRRMARAIAKDRQARAFATTRQLAGMIERISPRAGRKSHPATRLFQALRIAVNDELESLRRGLAAAVGVLRPGGRLSVITFHSLEDRMVKEFGRERSRGYEFPGDVDVPELRREVPPTLRWVERKGVRPGAAELEDNSRSRSAQLRILEKI